MNMEKPKWWQKGLSYFMEVVLERRSSAVNKLLIVSLIRNRYQLSTEASIYSFDDLYMNYHRAFSQVELPDEGARVLVLGLGLASVPFMLEKTFGHNYEITAIELDELVIELASKYTLTRLDNPIQVIHTDAEVFVKTSQSEYDLVIVDLFLEDVIPTFFESVEGNHKVKELLAPGGLVMYNRLYRTGKDKQKTLAFYENNFKKVFKKGSYLDVGGNWILLGTGK